MLLFNLVFTLLVGHAACAPVLSNQNPYANLTQSWGLKDMSMEDYRPVFVEYLKTHDGESFTVDTLPWWFNDRLIMQNRMTNYAYYITQEEYTKICDREHKVDCNLKTDLCVKSCYYQLWYPGFENEIFRHTKNITVDWTAYIKEQKDKDAKKYAPYPDNTDYEAWDDDEVQIIV